MILRNINDNQSIKVKSKADVSYNVTQQINAKLDFVTCFRTTEYITVTSDIYNQGYIELDRIPSSPQSVIVEQVNGTIMVSKYANGPFADYDVYNQYVIIRNGADIDGYVSSGLTDIIEEGDNLLIHYGFSSTTNLKQIAFTISQTDVDQGYHKLPTVPVSAQAITAYVAQGSSLVNRQVTGSTGDYVVFSDFFIIRNNVNVLGYISNGLSENIDVGDTILLIYL